ncbi:MAG: CaiB/BaiF CoA-transferase family protein [Smithellaceae bacterium]|nr:CaiB/BaiF CoA-transferase family protein [Smithellaceae bacterium]
MEATASQEKPLTGVRVVDLTRVLSGPFCTMILKNLGAEVIKLERAGVGDEARFIGPFFGKDGTKSAYFLSVNAGKKSVALDLKTTAGREILTKLIERSHVLVENFRPGTMAKLGFPEEEIRKINSALVYIAISGFGKNGPLAQRPAFDMIIQALSGIISITGLDKDRRTRVGTSISDIIAGMYGAIGICAGLYRRGITGRGAHVDVAMLDSTVAILENAIVRYQATGLTPGPIGTRHPSMTPFGSFQTKDSEIVITASTDKFFLMLCDLIGRPEIKEDPRFRTNELRTENASTLSDIINGAMASQTTTWWLDKLEAAGIPCAPLNNVADLFADGQIHARNMLVPVVGEDLRIAGNPIKIDGVPDGEAAGSYPRLGEHNDEVLEGLLGYSAAEVQDFYETGILSRETGSGS